MRPGIALAATGSRGHGPAINGACAPRSEYPRRRDDTFCARCWDAVPRWIKQALAAAGRARDTARQTALWIEASDAVKSAMPAHAPTRPRTDGKRAYARTAEILGEHDEIEAAE